MRLISEEWFESKPPYNDIKNPKLPSLDEENCVKEFYDRFINKDEKTDTVIAAVIRA